MAKKKTNTTKKSTYRGNKKPSMQARKRATQVTNQKKKQNRNTQPIPKTQIIFSALQDIFGTVLILGSTFSLGSLAFQDMNSATAWLAGKMHFIFGQTAVFVGIVGIVLGIWLVFLRRLDKPFSFSWKIFTFCLLVYLFVLVSIQHFAVMQIPFTSSDQAGGIFGEKADNLLIGAFGNGGTLIILFFIATIFVLITWREFLKILPESVGQKLDITEKMWKKVKEIFMVTPAENSREKMMEPEIPIQRLTGESTSPENPSSGNETVTIPGESEYKNDSAKNHFHLSDQKGEFREKERTENKNQEISTKPVQPVVVAATPESMNKPFTPPLLKKIQVKDLSSHKPLTAEKWRLPATDEILDPLKSQQKITPDDPYVQSQVQKIEHVLEIFDAPGKVVDIQCGPTFTQFGIQPGFLDRQDRKVRVRVKQIEALKKDLEMALSVKQLSIDAPIPGKTYIGLQVQNRHRYPVTLREVIESDGFRKYQNGLGIALGKDIYGETYAADLTRMPHLLIAGATGSGKSVCLNAILVCLLMHHSPESLKLVLIDPKRVELTGYNGVPHLITPVVTDVEKVSEILQWVLREMDNRNQHFLEAGVRNIQDFNQKFPEQRMPYIVVVIDELANLMMEAATEIESSITRLAQTARAMGIHLVVATQRPSRDVITGTIKGNLPSRIAFAVATNTDSLVILDRVGAEDLFGKGDMYLMSAEDPNLKRLQCVYVSDDEIRRLVDYWRSNPKISEVSAEEIQPKPELTPITLHQPPQKFDGVLTQLPLLDENEPAMKRSADPLLDDAIALVRKQGRASANMLVSRLSIGFGRANKLLVQMEEMGIIGPPNANPSIPREVLDYGENRTPSKE